MQDLISQPGLAMSRKWKGGLAAGVAGCVMILAVASPGAADATADAKAALDLEKARYDTAKAGVDSELAAIKQLQSITGGVGDATAAEASSEALVLTHHVYDGLSARLAHEVHATKLSGAPLVIFGSTPPTMADVIAFDEALARLRQNLADANALWVEAQNAAKAREASKAHVFDFKIAPAAVAAPIAVIASVADLFTVDTSYKGGAVTVKDEQFDTQLARALQDAKTTVDYDAYLVAPAPTYVQAGLDSLKEPVRTARDYYLQGYMPLFLKANGKTGDMDGGIAAAGKNLETVLSDYDSARKAMFTPVAGVLPAAVITREATMRGDIAQRPILYIRSHRAAVTTDIRKGFFVGWFKPPVHLTVAAVVDYVIVGGPGGATAGSLGCASRRIYVMDVATLNPTKAPSKGSGAGVDDGTRAAVCTTDFADVAAQPLP